MIQYESRSSNHLHILQFTPFLQTCTFFTQKSFQSKDKKPVSCFSFSPSTLLLVSLVQHARFLRCFGLRISRSEVSSHVFSRVPFRHTPSNRTTICASDSDDGTNRVMSKCHFAPVLCVSQSPRRSTSSPHHLCIDILSLHFVPSPSSMLRSMLALIGTHTCTRFVRISLYSSVREKLSPSLACFALRCSTHSLVTRAVTARFPSHHVCS